MKEHFEISLLLKQKIKNKVPQALSKSQRKIKVLLCREKVWLQLKEFLCLRKKYLESQWCHVKVSQRRNLKKRVNLQCVNHLRNLWHPKSI